MEKDDTCTGTCNASRFSFSFDWCVSITHYFFRESTFKSSISLSFNKFNILITIDIDLFSLLYASFDIIKSIQLRAKRFLFILMTRKKISKYNSNAMINCMYEYNTLTRSTSAA